MSAVRRWLSIVGIGEDGLDGLSPAARALLAQASLVVGGRRHLSLAAGATRGETLAWPSPPQAAFPAILARRDASVCVLATGDPFFYGIGSLLAREVPAEQMICLPAASSFSLAASRLGWAVQDCALVSLHGRPLQRILPHLQPRARILALSWDQTTPRRLADLLTQHGFGDTRITVCEAIGGPRERLTGTTAADFALESIDPGDPAGTWTTRLVVRARRSTDQTGHPSRHPVRAGAPTGRTAVGRRRRIGVHRHRVDAGLRIEPRHSGRTRRHPRRSDCP
jgi:precorrin-6Y C5,15-methyltransferase (decarboxylating)